MSANDAWGSGPPSPTTTHPTNTPDWIAGRSLSASPPASSAESLVTSGTALSVQRGDGSNRSRTAGSRGAHFPTSSTLRPGRRSQDLPSTTFSVHARPSSPEVDQSNPRSSGTSLPEGQSSRQNSNDAIPHASSMKLSEFRNANKQFRWNYDKPLETHRNFPASSCFPLHWAGHIGRTDTALVYACNTEEKLHGFKDTVAVKLIDIEKKKHGQRKKAEDECKNLRAVSHHHIIAYLGSFTYMRDFGIVMFPVAEFHLGDLLRIVSEDNKSRRQDDARPPHAYLELLKSYFGCLCRALMHLHHRDDPIKHKDIKPANILVDRYKNIILTDFGISKHYENKLAARTTGDTHHTVMYAPPEVFNSNDYRDLDSDIFSLGCVFLEMATVILDRTLKDLYRHLEEDVQETVHTEDDSTSQGIICYARNLAKVDQWIEELRTRCQRLSDVSQCQESGSLSDATLQTIRRMMSSKQDERPGLAELWTDFKGLSKNCTSCMEEADRHAAASNVPDIAITAEIADKREETQSSLDRLEGVQEEVSALTPPLPPPELESQIVEEMPALDLADIRLAKNDSQSSQASEAIASAGRPSGDVRPVSWEGSSTTEVAAAQGPTGAPTETGADVSDNPTRDIVEREVALSSALEKTPASPIAGEAEDNDRLSESTAEDSRKQISTNAPVFRRTPMVTFVDPQPETELTPRGGSASARSSDTAQDSEDRVSSDHSRNDENIEGVETIPGHMRGPPYHQAAHSVGPEILQKLPAQSDNEGTVPSKKKTYTITVFDWQRGSWKLDHYRDVPGKMVVVFNDGNKLLETVPKDRVDWTRHHLLMPLPRTDGWKYRTVEGDLDLWKRLPPRVNIKRIFGSTRMLLFEKEYRMDQLMASTMHKPIGTF